MNRRIAFVLSDVRSGSTLLDQLLGAHPEVHSLGELHWLPAYVTQDRRIYDPVYEIVCTCGRTVSACPFWMQVANRLGRPLESLQLRASLTLNKRRLLARFPGAIRIRSLANALLGRQLVSDNLALIDCLFEVSACRVMVDSSKSTHRFRIVYDARPTQAIALVLTRDFRAVVHSKMKRGHSLESAARGWRNKMREIAALTDDLPRQHVHQVSYEDLCGNPAIELSRICKFLGIEFSPAMLQRPVAGTHHIGGSPSKFDRSRILISMDTAYKSAFTPTELDRLATLVGDTATRWGYQ